MASSSDLRSLAVAGKAVVGRPDLWPTAAKAMVDLAPNQWWRTRPFLPVPDSRWLHFRLVTAYGGDGSQQPVAQDIVTWLEWRRSFD